MESVVVEIVCRDELTLHLFEPPRPDDYGNGDIWQSRPFEVKLKCAEETRTYLPIKYSVYYRRSDGEWASFVVYKHVAVHRTEIELDAFQLFDLDFQDAISWNATETTG